MSAPRPGALAFARRVLSAGLAAGLAAGLLVAGLDLVGALLRRTEAYGLDAFLAGAASALLIDLGLGVVTGLVLACAAAGIFGWSRFGRAARRTGAVLVEVTTASAPEREAARTGAIVAIALVAALVAAWIAGATLLMLPRIALSPSLAWPVAMVLAVVVAAGACLLRPLARGLARSIDALPAPVRQRISVRNLALLILASLAVLIAQTRAELSWLLSALGAWPLLLLGIMVAAATIVLAGVAGWPSGRATRLLVRPAVLAAPLGALGLAYLLVTLGVGQEGPALRVYRADAPLAALAAPHLGRVLGGGGASFARCPPRECEGDACTGIPRPPPPAPVPASVPEELSFVVIMVDALRHDHLHVAGYPRPISPNLDRLAAGALVFERALSPAAYTIPSVSAMMTSRLPSQLPGALHKKAGIPADAPTLARQLAGAGYHTLYLNDYGAETRKGHLETGFARHKTVHDKGHRITEMALDFLDEVGDERFFLWTTYMGPHEPYRLHDDMPQYGRSFLDLYDQEIAKTDQHLGPLLERLQRPPLADRVVVVVIADHGEAFGEHGTYNHGHNLHQENVHVPLILRVPGVPHRRLGGAPVSLLDLYPTVLNLARLPVPAGAVGHDLTPIIAGGDLPADRLVFVEGDYRGYPFSPGYQAALVRGRHKLMIEEKTRSVRLYDLDDDPGEQHDLAGRMPDLTCELLALLQRFRSGE